MGLGGRIGLTLFFGVFFAMGSVFTGFLVRDAVNALRSRTWPTADAEILASSVEMGADDYRFAVRYRYQYDGRSYESTIFQERYNGGDNYARPQQLVARYPVGSKVRCYVNPAHPAEAMLALRSPWIALAIPFPLIFVAIGLGGMWFAWRRTKPDNAAPTPISSTRRSLNSNRVGVVFCAIFAVIGAALFYFLTVRTFLKVQAARSWPTVPCVVESSRVKSHDSDDGTTYSADILYRYQVAGREYRSNRFSFMGGSSSGYDGKAAVVRQYPPGRRTECFVNPANPNDAVLVRGFTPMMWFGLIPLAFLLFGTFGLVHFARGGATTMPAMATGPATLKPKTSPGTKLLGMILIAAFWNGIVSVFVTQAVKGWQRGHPDYFLTIFMIPFVLVGLGLIGGIGYCLLALFNPRVRLTIGSRQIPVGGAVDLQWQMSGRATKLRRLEIVLEGREEATYQRGTTTVTDKEVFTTIPVLDTTNPWDMQSGRARLMIPPGTMHTFRAEHNKILWTLRIRGDIPRWPDIKEEYEITVLPQ
jgi:hypothetical protein